MARAFRVGARVDGLYDANADDVWYPARVRSITCSHSDGEPRYELLYDDGEMENEVSPSCVRAHATGNISVGTRVIARYAGGDELYAGKIAEVQDNGLYTIEYDDTEVETDVPLEHIQEPPEEEENGEDKRSKEDGDNGEVGGNDSEPTPAANEPVYEQHLDAEDTDGHSLEIATGEASVGETVDINRQVTRPPSQSEPISSHPAAIQLATGDTDPAYTASKKATFALPPPLVHAARDNSSTNPSAAATLESLELLRTRLSDGNTAKSALSTLVKQMRSFPQDTAALVSSHVGEELLLDVLATHQAHAVVQCYAFVLLRRLCFLSATSTRALLLSDREEGVVSRIVHSMQSFADDAILQAAACGALAVFTREPDGIALLLDQRAATAVIASLRVHRTYSVHTRQVHYYGAEVLLELCELEDQDTMAALCTDESKSDTSSEASPIELLLFLLRQALSFEDKKVCCAVGSLTMCLAASDRAAASRVLRLNGLPELSTVMAKYATEPGIQKYAAAASKAIALSSIQKTGGQGHKQAPPSKKVRERAAEILMESSSLESLHQEAHRTKTGRSGATSLRHLGVAANSAVTARSSADPVRKRKANGAGYGASPRSVHGGVSTNDPLSFSKFASPIGRAPQYDAFNGQHIGNSVQKEQQLAQSTHLEQLQPRSSSNLVILDTREDKQSLLFDTYGIPAAARIRSSHGGVKRTQLKTHLVSGGNSWATRVSGQQLIRDDMLSGPSQLTGNYSAATSRSDRIHTSSEARTEEKGMHSPTRQANTGRVMFEQAYADTIENSESTGLSLPTKTKKKRKKNAGLPGNYASSAMSSYVANTTALKVRIESEAQQLRAKALRSPFASPQALSKREHDKIQRSRHGAATPKQSRIHSGMFSPAGTDSMNAYATHLFRDDGSTTPVCDNKPSTRDRADRHEHGRLSFADKLHKMIDKAKSTLTNVNVTTLPIDEPAIAPNPKTTSFSDRPVAPASKTRVHQATKDSVGVTAVVQEPVVKKSRGLSESTVSTKKPKVLGGLSTVSKPVTPVSGRQPVASRSTTTPSKAESTPRTPKPATSKIRAPPKSTKAVVQTSKKPVKANESAPDATTTTLAAVVENTFVDNTASEPQDKTSAAKLREETVNPLSTESRDQASIPDSEVLVTSNGEPISKVSAEEGESTTDLEAVTALIPALACADELRIKELEAVEIATEAPVSVPYAATCVEDSPSVQVVPRVSTDTMEVDTQQSAPMAVECNVSSDNSRQQAEVEVSDPVTTDAVPEDPAKDPESECQHSSSSSPETSELPEPDNDTISANQPSDSHDATNDEEREQEAGESAVSAAQSSPRAATPMDDLYADAENEFDDDAPEPEDDEVPTAQLSEVDATTDTVGDPPHDEASAEAVALAAVEPNVSTLVVCKSGDQLYEDEDYEEFEEAVHETADPADFTQNLADVAAFENAKPSTMAVDPSLTVESAHAAESDELVASTSQETEVEILPVDDVPLTIEDGEPASTASEDKGEIDSHDTMLTTIVNAEPEPVAVEAAEDEPNASSSATLINDEATTPDAEEEQCAGDKNSNNGDSAESDVASASANVDISAIEQNDESESFADRPTTAAYGDDSFDAENTGDVEVIPGAAALQEESYELVPTAAVSVEAEASSVLASSSLGEDDALATKEAEIAKENEVERAIGGETTTFDNTVDSNASELHTEDDGVHSHDELPSGGSLVTATEDSIVADERVDSEVLADRPATAVYGDGMFDDEDAGSSDAPMDVPQGVEAASAQANSNVDEIEPVDSDIGTLESGEPHESVSPHDVTSDEAITVTDELGDQTTKSERFDDTPIAPDSSDGAAIELPAGEFMNTLEDVVADAENSELFNDQSDAKSNADGNQDEVEDDYGDGEFDDEPGQDLGKNETADADSDPSPPDAGATVVGDDSALVDVECSNTGGGTGGTEIEASESCTADAKTVGEAETLETKIESAVDGDAVDAMDSKPLENETDEATETPGLESTVLGDAETESSQEAGVVEISVPVASADSTATVDDLAQTGDTDSGSKSTVIVAVDPAELGVVVSAEEGEESPTADVKEESSVDEVPVAETASDADKMDSTVVDQEEAVQASVSPDATQEGEGADDSAGSATTEENASTIEIDEHERSGASGEIKEPQETITTEEEHCQTSETSVDRPDSSIVDEDTNQLSVPAVDTDVSGMREFPDDTAAHPASIDIMQGVGEDEPMTEFSSHGDDPSDNIDISAPVSGADDRCAAELGNTWDESVKPIQREGSGSFEQDSDQESCSNRDENDAGSSEVHISGEEDQIEGSASGNGRDTIESHVEGEEETTTIEAGEDAENNEAARCEDSQDDTEPPNELELTETTAEAVDGDEDAYGNEGFGDDEPVDAQPPSLQEEEEEDSPTTQIADRTGKTPDLEDLHDVTPSTGRSQEDGKTTARSDFTDKYDDDDEFEADTDDTAPDETPADTDAVEDNEKSNGVEISSDSIVSVTNELNADENEKNAELENFTASKSLLGTSLVDDRAGGVEMEPFQLADGRLDEISTEKSQLDHLQVDDDNQQYGEPKQELVDEDHGEVVAANMTDSQPASVLSDSPALPGSDSSMDQANTIAIDSLAVGANDVVGDDDSKLPLQNSDAQEGYSAQQTAVGDDTLTTGVSFNADSAESALDSSALLQEDVSNEPIVSDESDALLTSEPNKEAGEEEIDGAADSDGNESSNPEDERVEQAISPEVNLLIQTDESSNVSKIDAERLISPSETVHDIDTENLNVTKEEPEESINDVEDSDLREVPRDDIIPVETSSPLPGATELSVNDEEAESLEGAQGEDIAAPTTDTVEHSPDGVSAGERSAADLIDGGSLLKNPVEVTHSEDGESIYDEKQEEPSVLATVSDDTNIDAEAPPENAPCDNEQPQGDGESVASADDQVDQAIGMESEVSPSEPSDDVEVISNETANEGEVVTEVATTTAADVVDEKMRTVAMVEEATETEVWTEAEDDEKLHAKKTRVEEEQSGEEEAHNVERTQTEEETATEEKTTRTVEATTTEGKELAEVIQSADEETAVEEEMAADVVAQAVEQMSLGEMMTVVDKTQANEEVVDDGETQVDEEEVSPAQNDARASDSDIVSTESESPSSQSLANESGELVTGDRDSLAELPDDAQKANVEDEQELPRADPQALEMNDISDGTDADPEDGIIQIDSSSALPDTPVAAELAIAGDEPELLDSAQSEHIGAAPSNAAEETLEKTTVDGPIARDSAVDESETYMDSPSASDEPPSLNPEEELRLMETPVEIANSEDDSATHDEQQETSSDIILGVPAGDEVNQTTDAVESEMQTSEPSINVEAATAEPAAEEVSMAIMTEMTGGAEAAAKAEDATVSREGMAVEKLTEAAEQTQIEEKMEAEEKKSTDGETLDEEKSGVEEAVSDEKSLPAEPVIPSDDTPGLFTQDSDRAVNHDGESLIDLPEDGSESSAERDHEPPLTDTPANGASDEPVALLDPSGGTAALSSDSTTSLIDEGMHAEDDTPFDSEETAPAVDVVKVEEPEAATEDAYEDDVNDFNVEAISVPPQTEAESSLNESAVPPRDVDSAETAVPSAPASPDTDYDEFDNDEDVAASSTEIAKEGVLTSTPPDTEKAVSPRVEETEEYGDDGEYDESEDDYSSPPSEETDSIPPSISSSNAASPRESDESLPVVPTPHSEVPRPETSKRKEVEDDDEYAADDDYGDEADFDEGDAKATAIHIISTKSKPAAEEEAGEEENEYEAEYDEFDD